MRDKKNKIKMNWIFHGLAAVSLTILNSCAHLTQTDSPPSGQAQTKLIKTQQNLDPKTQQDGLRHRLIILPFISAANFDHQEIKDLALDSFKQDFV